MQIFFKYILSWSAIDFIVFLWSPLNSDIVDNNRAFCTTPCLGSLWEPRIEPGEPGGPREPSKERAECAHKVIAPCAVMRLRPCPAPRARAPHPASHPHPPPHCLVRSAADKGEPTGPTIDTNHFNANLFFHFAPEQCSKARTPPAMCFVLTFFSKLLQRKRLVRAVSWFIYDAYIG